MIQLSAPYPAIVTTTILPKPQLGDSEALTDQVQARRAMDGTLYTYVKRGNRRRLQFDLLISRLKALELVAFVRSYHSSRTKLVDHLDQTWIGYVTLNPVEFETTRGAEKSPGRERVTVRLEFEGAKQ